MNVAHLVALSVAAILILVLGALALWSRMLARYAEALVPADGQFLDVPGARLHFVDLGPRDGPAIVMVHGLMGQLRNFTHSLAGRLARDHRVIVIDRPGWGYSRLNGPRPGVGAQAEMIAALIATLELDRPLVVGHSMGGAVALALALAHPERLRGLALIAPFTQPGAALPEPFRGLQLPTMLRPLIGATIATPIALFSGKAKSLQIFAPDPVPNDFAIRGGGVLSIRSRNFRSGAFEIGIAPTEIAALAERYANIKLPVAILYGRQDAVLDPFLHGAKTAEMIAHARLDLIDGGHMLPITRADATENWLRSAIDIG